MLYALFYLFNLRIMTIPAVARELNQQCPIDSVWFLTKIDFRRWLLHGWKCT